MTVGNSYGRISCKKSVAEFYLLSCMHIVYNFTNRVKVFPSGGDWGEYPPPPTPKKWLIHPISPH